MSSSIDAGYYADQAYKEKNKKCPESTTGQHKWIQHGTWPSKWEVCKYCKKTIYYK